MKLVVLPLWCLLLLLPVTGLCGPETLPRVEHLPVVSGSPESRSTPFISWHGDAARAGYFENEYLVSGLADVYSEVSNSEETGHLEVEISSVPYVTRMLVRRPDSPADFNGTVIVEILNPTAGWDGDPIWLETHPYLTRKKAVWVGLSSKPVTINFLRDKWGEPGISAPRNRSRYEKLSMPYFGQVWDMLTQVSALLRSDSAAGNPLKDLAIKKLILTGYSQSVDYGVTYANHFHDPKLVDGYYLAAGSGTVKKLNRLDGEEELTLGHPGNLIVVDAPVIRFQTQTEVEEARFSASRVRQSQDEYPLLRIYEMAGGAHVDVNTSLNGARSLARDMGIRSQGSGCELPINPLPLGFVQMALLDALVEWLDGTPPPDSQFLLLSNEVLSNGVLSNENDLTLVKDGNGNALGGIRLPQLAMPKGQYLAANRGAGFCFLFGGFAPYSRAEFLRRYQSEQDYLAAIDLGLQSTINQRFLLAADREPFLEHVRRTIASLD